MKKSVWCSVTAVMLALGAQAAGDKVVLPDIEMEQNGLPFRLIEGYGEYRIVATHYRTDKHELRYILADPVAYEALQKGVSPLPEGSKVVKIGWDVAPMERFPAALEARTIQRVEYMVKDSTRFDRGGDHWGYARFVKAGDGYESWKGDTAECAACHSAAADTDYLFTRMQKTFE